VRVASQQMLLWAVLVVVGGGAAANSLRLATDITREDRLNIELAEAVGVDHLAVSYPGGVNCTLVRRSGKKAGQGTGSPICQTITTGKDCKTVDRVRVKNVTEDCSLQAEYCQYSLRTEQVKTQTIICQRSGRLACEGECGDDCPVRCERNPIVVCASTPQTVAVTERRQRCGPARLLTTTKVCFTYPDASWVCQKPRGGQQDCDAESVKVVSHEVGIPRIDCQEKEMEPICVPANCRLATNSSDCLNTELPGEPLRLEDQVCEPCQTGRVKLRPVLEKVEECEPIEERVCAPPPPASPVWTKRCRLPRPIRPALRRRVAAVLDRKRDQGVDQRAGLRAGIKAGPPGRREQRRADKHVRFKFSSLEDVPAPTAGPNSPEPTSDPNNDPTPEAAQVKTPVPARPTPAPTGVPYVLAPNTQPSPRFSHRPTPPPAPSHAPSPASSHTPYLAMFASSSPSHAPDSTPPSSHAPDSTPRPSHAPDSTPRSDQVPDTTARATLSIAQPRDYGQITSNLQQIIAGVSLEPKLKEVELTSQRAEQKVKEKTNPSKNYVKVDTSIQDPVNNQSQKEMTADERRKSLFKARNINIFSRPATPARFTGKTVLTIRKIIDDVEVENQKADRSAGRSAAAVLHPGGETGSQGVSAEQHRQLGHTDTTAPADNTSQGQGVSQGDQGVSRGGGQEERELPADSISLHPTQPGNQPPRPTLQSKPHSTLPFLAPTKPSQAFRPNNIFDVIDRISKKGAEPARDLEAEPSSGKMAEQNNSKHIENNVVERGFKTIQVKEKDEQRPNQKVKITNEGRDKDEKERKDKKKIHKVEEQERNEEDERKQEEEERRAEAVRRAEEKRQEEEERRAAEKRLEAVGQCNHLESRQQRVRCKVAACFRNSSYCY